MKFLIIDDSDLLQNILQETLEENLPTEEHQIRLCRVEDEVRSCLQKGAPEMILIDAEIEEMDVMLLIKEIRLSELHVPIILTAGLNSDENAEQNLLDMGKAGVNAFLVKPVRQDKLWRQIRQFLENPSLIGNKVSEIRESENRSGRHSA